MIYFAFLYLNLIYMNICNSHLLLVSFIIFPKWKCCQYELKIIPDQRKQKDIGLFFGVLF